MESARPSARWTSVARATAVAALLFAVATVAVPAPFRWTASILVERTGLPEVLREVDARMRTLEALPEAVWERLRAPFDADEPPPELPASEPPPGPGRLESAVAGGLASAVELGLRAVTLAIALSAAVSSLALWAVAATLGRLAEARARTRALEERVVALERRTGAPDGAGSGPGGGG